MGTRKFVELCHRLEVKYGSRFTRRNALRYAPSGYVD
jgi:hypothetical protein